MALFNAWIFTAYEFAHAVLRIASHLQFIGENFDLLLKLADALTGHCDQADEFVALIFDQLIQLLEVVVASHNLLARALEILHDHMLERNIVLGQLDLALRICCNATDPVALSLNLADDYNSLRLLLLKDADFIFQCLHFLIAGLEQLVLNAALYGNIQH